ncbi:MAG TPA: hypothetical protein VKV15_05710 [Bryobacteraceae bacterium]|nr:hypothetical protein [Bryobacteraceae bacterium]
MAECLDPLGRIHSGEGDLRSAQAMFQQALDVEQHAYQVDSTILMERYRRLAGAV